MFDTTKIMRDRQRVIRREMDRRGISLKAVSFDSGISYSTIVSYFSNEKDKEPAAISAAAMFMLAAGNALPLDLLSMLLPDGLQMVRVPEGVDHDEFETIARDYLAAKGKAHHPDSPGGREITDCERAGLDCKVVQLRGGVAA